MQARAYYFPFFLPCLVIIVCSRLLAQQPNDAPIQDSPYTFKSNVDVVLVPVLVRDRQGRALGNLTKKDFQVFDNDKAQVISGFSMQTRARIEGGTGPAQPACDVGLKRPEVAPAMEDDRHRVADGQAADAQ